MQSAVLNCENMRDLSHIVFSRARRDVSSQLLSFALSSKSAFCSIATFAKKHLLFQLAEDCNYAYLHNVASGKKTQFFLDSHLLHICRSFAANVVINYIPVNQYELAAMLDFLKDMTNLKNLIIFYDVDNAEFDDFDAYDRVLKANMNYSMLGATKLLFLYVKRLPTATPFPNVTEIVIHDHLSKIVSSKFTRSTFPLLETLDFIDSNLSKEGIRKLAKLCKTMSDTLQRVKIYVKRSRTLTVEKNVMFCRLFRDHFQKLEFDKEFTLDICVSNVDHVVHRRSGFRWSTEAKCWFFKAQCGNIHLLYTLVAD